ncbi:MAG: RES family NAD+ phosphorylase [Planctomycetaceae bacterium]|nr:RES family NAD+ phosphorylase [Planctomycetaceae bacterium]
MIKTLGTRLEELPGRPETGRWLHLTAGDPVSGAVELIELMEHGGRFNPPKAFPVAYFAEDSKSCRSQLNRWLQKEPEADRFTVLIAEMQLSKVLDLDDAAVRRRVGISMADLVDQSSWDLSQSIGAAARRAGFLGVIYPRPRGAGGLNLAAFCDRTSSQEINIVGAGHCTP